VDVTDPAGGFLSGVLLVGIDDASLELQKNLDEEYDELVSDCRLLRESIFHHTATAQYLPVNLPRIVHNATQIFHTQTKHIRAHLLIKNNFISTHAQSIGHTSASQLQHHSLSLLRLAASVRTPAHPDVLLQVRADDGPQSTQSYTTRYV
jgi:hypothetical protein